MIDTILTPTALWKNFNISEDVISETIKEENENGIIYTSLQIEGRKLKDGNVKIYAEFIHNAQSTICPAILLIEDFEINDDKKLAKDLVSKGYSVLTIDLAGKREGKENYTIYPQSIEYANLENSRQNLNKVIKDAKSTCWYEWCAVLRYALKYLKSLPNITKVGGFALSSVATALWQLAGTDHSLDCVVFGLNAGWLGYKDILKYSGMIEPQFSDDMYKYIAGIDSQSYAMHIKCPSMILSATNSNDFDIDRAYDTLTKIPENVYSSIHYSPLEINRINYQAYNNTEIFFKKFLMGENLILPNQTEIKCDIIDGKIRAEISVDKQCPVDKVAVYYAEEFAKPSIRGWQRICAKKNNENQYLAEFVPFKQAELVTIFANVKYKNGFETSTNIIAKRFKDNEVKDTFKSTLLYSSRINDSKSIFAPASPAIENSQFVDILDKGTVKTKKGPMDIEGVCCKGGLLTFIIGSKKYLPTNGAMFMLDVYSQQASELVVKLVADYFGSKTEYISRKNLLGGNVWHNVKIEMNKFKTEEGIVLKDYSKINALEINVEGSTYLINNALWI